MLRAGVDPHRVQRVLRHASVTTTTGTYAHLAIEDLRDAVSKIGTQQPEPSPVADSLRTSLQTGPAASEDGCPKGPENAALDGAPGRSRTCGPRLRRPLLYPAELQARGPASAFTPRTRQAAPGSRRSSAPARTATKKQGHRLLWTRYPTLQSHSSPSLTPGRARSRTLRFLGQVARGSGWTDAGRGGREAEGAGLLNQYTVQSCIEGSNPSLSATVRRRALSSVG